MASPQETRYPRIRKAVGWAVSFLVVLLIDHLLTPYIASFPIRLLADAALVFGGSIVFAVVVVLGRAWVSRGWNE